MKALKEFPKYAGGKAINMDDAKTPYFSSDVIGSILSLRSELISIIEIESKKIRLLQNSIQNNCLADYLKERHFVKHNL